MISHKFGKGSEVNLVGVRPDLITVIRRGLQLSPYDFGITQGMRTNEKQSKMYAEGGSLTMNSMHLKQSDGFSHAVDIAVYVDGRITWEHKYYRKVIQSIFTAAIEEGLQITAGALWRDFLDSPHIEINKAY